MGNYIDLDKAIERLNASPAFPNMGTDGFFLLGVVEDLLKRLPTIEFVRCRNCMWWEAKMYGSTIGRCQNPNNGLRGEYVEDDDFCSYGARMKGGERE